MCNIYNPVGSSKTIKSHLKRCNINGLNSLDEIIEFQKRYFAIRGEIVADYELKIEKEKNTLAKEIKELSNSIREKKDQVAQKYESKAEHLKAQLCDLSLKTTNYVEAVSHKAKKLYITCKIHTNELAVYPLYVFSTISLVHTLRRKNRRYQYIVNNFSDAVNKAGSSQLRKLDKKKRALDEIDSHIYGALGEQKVVAELEKLDDGYFLINDFDIFFPKAIRNRNRSQYIKSIQIDHLLVAPAGVFLIETKNWSEESITGLSLRSPVEQRERTNFALYTILARKTNQRSFLNLHHWGEKKIPIRNIITMIRNKPKEEFKFVKVLTLPQLTNYVKYFEPVFTDDETRGIADYLIGIANRGKWNA